MVNTYIHDSSQPHTTYPRKNFRIVIRSGRTVVEQRFHQSSPLHLLYGHTAAASVIAERRELAGGIVGLRIEAAHHVRRRVGVAGITSVVAFILRVVQFIFRDFKG